MTQPASNNNVFIITGAASGIGRELALQAAQKGAVVIATDRNETELAETANIGAGRGLSMQHQVLDVADGEAISRFAESVTSKLAGHKLVLINNAGVGLSSGTFRETELADFEWLLNINLWGAIRLTKAFYPYFFSRGEGHIVNISSVFGFIGVANNVSYCTSKFALRGFSESLRMELRGSGINIMSVHPGGIKTNIVRNALLKSEVVTADTHQKSITSFDKRALTTAASAATQILLAIDKNKTRLVIGRDGKAIDWLARLLPVSYTSILASQMKKTF